MQTEEKKKKPSIAVLRTMVWLPRTTIEIDRDSSDLGWSVKAWRNELPRDVRRELVTDNEIEIACRSDSCSAANYIKKIVWNLMLMKQFPPELVTPCLR